MLCSDFSKSWRTGPVVLLLLAACATPHSSTDPQLSISLNEWTVDLSADMIEPGQIAVEVVNEGLLMHEAIIVATDHPNEPLATVGGLVDIGGDSVELIGEIAELSPEDRIGVTLDLEPGTYILFCNIPGHYDAGMSTVLTVEG